MPSWTDCRSGYFHGYACDMGPYIGPWPLMPTGVIAGLDPTYGDEIDFVLGLPNPADPSDPTIAFDGSYAAQVWTAYRFVRSDFPPGGSREDWLTDGTGGAVAPDGTAAPPPGVHLYVVGKTHTTPPPNAPDSYVPPSYTVGGTATVQTVQGGWSGWQASLALSDTSSTTPTGSLSDGGSASHDEEGDLPIPSVAADCHTDIVARPPTAVRGGATSGGIFSFVGGKGAPTIAHPTGDTAATIGTFNQFSIDLEALPTQPRPPLITTGTEGVDYGDKPFALLAYDYEDPEVSDFHWGVLSCTATAAWNMSLSTNFPRVSATLGVKLLPDEIAAGTTGFVSGPNLATLVVDPDIGDAGSDTDLSPIDLPTTIHLAVVIDSVEYKDLPMPDSGVVRYAWDGSFAFVTGTAYTWSTGRWRYWLPNPIVPVLNWHTAGGHWATPGGATMRIQTPGVGWVDVVDGPG